MCVEQTCFFFIRKYNPLDFAMYRHNLSGFFFLGWVYVAVPIFKSALSEITRNMQIRREFVFGLLMFAFFPRHFLLLSYKKSVCFYRCMRQPIAINVAYLYTFALSLSPPLFGWYSILQTYYTRALINIYTK